MYRYRETSPDPTECGCLKTLVLFKSDTSGLGEQQAVEQLQEQAQIILAEYVTNTYPAQPMRYFSLYYQLPSSDSLLDFNINNCHR
jgi:hypothetical protein